MLDRVVACFNNEDTIFETDQPRLNGFYGRVELLAHWRIGGIGHCLLTTHHSRSPAERDLRFATIWSLVFSLWSLVDWGLIVYSVHRIIGVLAH